MSRDRFDDELRSVIRRTVPREAPDRLRDRVLDATELPVGRASRFSFAWRVAAGVAAAVIVLVAAYAGYDLLRGTTPAPATSPSPSGVASASPQPTASPSVPTQHTTADWPTVKTTTAEVPTQLDLASTGFWTIETPPTLSDWVLRIGTLDGRVTRQVSLTPAMGPLDVSLIPQPVGPAGGRVLYVTDDGQVASLHVVDALTGADRELTRIDAFIPQLAIDPGGSTAYYLALDRHTGAVLGLYGVPTAGGGEPQQLIAGPPTTATATLAAQASYLPQLAVSSDGSWIVFASCRPTGCDLYAVNPTGDTLRVHHRTFRFGETIVGISGNLLIGSSVCTEASCAGFVIDLVTGDRWPLGGSDQPFAPKSLIAGPHGPLLLGQTETYDQGIWHVTALDLTDRTRSAVFSATFKPAYTVVGLADRLTAGAELPAGWFLIYRNADAAPNPYPDYSAATLGGSAEVTLPVMTFPRG
jgi:hypothetical protein